MSNYVFAKLIIRLIGGGLAPVTQTVGSLLISPWPAKPAVKMYLPLQKRIRQTANSTNRYVPNWEFVESIFVAANLFFRQALPAREKSIRILLLPIKFYLLGTKKIEQAVSSTTLT